MKNNKVSFNVYKNILIAVFIMIYFIIINTLYYKVETNKLLDILKILSMIILFMGIVVLEIAYRKENGRLGIHAIEIIVLAGYTLSISHIVELKKFRFANYILVSSYLFSIYYLLKSIVIYTKEKKDYLNSLSDIKEIVANDPIKKKATKKGVKYNEIN